MLSTWSGNHYFILKASMWDSIQFLKTQFVKFESIQYHTSSILNFYTFKFKLFLYKIGNFFKFQLQFRTKGLQ